MLKKFHYQKVNQINALLWCWLWILLFIGGILQLESDKLNYGALAVIIGTILIGIWILTRSRLQINVQQQTIQLSGLIASQQRQILVKDVQMISYYHGVCTIKINSRQSGLFKLIILPKAYHVLQQLINDGRGIQ